MYTPRAIFCRLFLRICPFVLSLYTLGGLVTLSCEISDQSPITCVNSHYRVPGQSMVCVHRLHNVNPKMQLKDMAMWIYKMAAGYNRKWRCFIRRTRKPHPRAKHEVKRTTRRWAIAIWNFSKWPPVAILNLTQPEMAPFDPPSPKPPP